MQPIIRPAAGGARAPCDRLMRRMMQNGSRCNESPSPIVNLWRICILMIKANPSKAGDANLQGPRGSPQASQLPEGSIMKAGMMRLSNHCVFDLDRQIILRAGKEYELSDIEFRLLALLADHPDEPIPLDVLIAYVWGSDPAGNRHNLANCIHRLRHHLGDPQLIVTVLEKGYKLNIQPIHSMK